MVEIVEWTPTWSTRFERARDELRAVLPPGATIEHIGSTSVAGLAAKPIIDILVVTADIGDLRANLAPLEALGYVFNPKYFAEDPDHLYLMRDHAGRRTEHLHIFHPRSPNPASDRAFRDYLASHQDAVARYAEAKRAAAGRNPDSRGAYAQAKEPVLQQLLHEARQWTASKTAQSPEGGSCGTGAAPGERSGAIREPAKYGEAAGFGYITWGSYPRYVMLHGFSDAASCWSPLLGDWHVGAIAIDARGHVRSSLPAGEISPFQQARDVALVLDELQLSASVVVGHSMGASTAAALAGMRPDLVEALILEEPSPGGGPAASRRIVPQWLAQARTSTWQEALAWCRAEYPRWPQDELEPWVASKRELNLDVFERPKSASPDLQQLMRSTRCPTLLIYGTGSGSVLNERVVADCVAGARHLDAVPIEAGHNVRRDARIEYLAAVTSWLATLPHSYSRRSRDHWSPHASA